MTFNVTEAMDSTDRSVEKGLDANAATRALRVGERMPFSSSFPLGLFVRW